MKCSVVNCLPMVQETRVMQHLREANVEEGICEKVRVEFKDSGFLIP